jgi:tripeptidyl-peptidase-1
MLSASIFLIAAAVQAVFSKPIQSRTAYAVKGAHPVPRQWIQRDRAPQGQMLSLQIGVKQSQFGELERHLYEGIALPRTSHSMCVC